jgi:hypothetical protein
MIDWKGKLTSRKLWVAVAGFVAGLILAFGGSETTAATVSGCIMSGASVIGYLLAEGLVDAANAGSEQTITSIKKEE